MRPNRMANVKNPTDENYNGGSGYTDAQHLPHRDFKTLIGCAHTS